MSDIENKRAYLGGLYGGTRRWRRQLDKMPDAQIISIYLKEQARAKPPHPVEALEEPVTHLEMPPHPPHENEDQFPLY